MKPTMNELQFYYNKHKNTKESDGGQIDFAEFLNILHSHMVTEQANDEILKAFKLYDVRKTGFITVNELRSILTKTGEKLTNKDVDTIIHQTNCLKDGKVYYQKLLSVLSNPIID
jgi:calmodulin